MRGLAVLKGMLAALLVMLMMLAISYSMELPSSREEHLAAMTYHKPVPLTNENLVDALSEHIDTSTLHAVSIRHAVLNVELLLHNDRPVSEQIYDTVPLYIALAFHYSSNVEELRLKVLQPRRQAGEELQLMQLTIHAGDAWLIQGVQALQGTLWLEQADWIKRLRIEKSIFWLPYYEV